MPTLTEYLVLAAILFGMGLAVTLSRRHTILMLAGIEMMLNAANVNLVAFWHFSAPKMADGQLFALFAIAIAGAEAAVGLAMVIAIYRRFHSANLEDADGLKG